MYGICLEKNFAMVKEMGALLFTYANKDWMQAIRELGGADIVTDSLGFES